MLTNTEVALRNYLKTLQLTCEPAMNCASTSCQTVTALTGPSLAVSARSQSATDGVLQTLRLAIGWWQQRLETQPAKPLTTLHDLSDHVLRDIGYLDGTQPREHSHRAQEY